ncbi:hypothetical protein QAD02_010145 [Eretmocerus hayati]|uniref:Uncharacterized protein n=1 Tax=Eretmocerus hayati TaxID=131215 RepID=A0ACC2NBL8_9HYME|nr:hypothetical protein QAD02_010145 [Eretmocerus hayati]
MDLKSYFYLTFMLALRFLLKSVRCEPLFGDEVSLVKSNQFSSVVLLRLKLKRYPEKDQEAFCTGTLISRKRILTASSCLKDGEYIKKIEVFLSHPEQCIDCKHYEVSLPWKTYEDWAHELQLILRYPKNDIIILELTEEVIEESVKPARLASEKEMRKLEGSKARMVGWVIVASEFPYSKIYQYFGKVKINSKTECKLASENLPGPSTGYLDTYLCTERDRHVFSTELDVGGPLFNKDGKIVGVFKETRSSKSDKIFDSKSLNGIHVFTSIDFYRYYIE